MVDNAHDLSLELAAHGIETKAVNFPGEDHFSVVPGAIGRAVPYALQQRR